jgi:Helix-turn-helix domain
MSIRVMSQVWEVDLPASQKIVLLALADCADEEGHCWPGIASLCMKASKSERTVQAMLGELEVAGHITRNQVPGKGCKYVVHPRKSRTPAESAPPQDLHHPPQNLRGTPANLAPKPSLNHQRTVRKKEKARARDFPSPVELPANWHPAPFAAGSKSRAIVDGWPPGADAEHLEHFCAHHRARGSKFKDWQEAWSTWVLNGAKFERSGNGQGSNTDRNGGDPEHDRRSALAKAIDEGLDYVTQTGVS